MQLCNPLLNCLLPLNVRSKHACHATQKKVMWHTTRHQRLGYLKCKSVGQDLARTLDIGVAPIATAGGVSLVQSVQPHLSGFQWWPTLTNHSARARVKLPAASLVLRCRVWVPQTLDMLHWCSGGAMDDSLWGVKLPLKAPLRSLLSALTADVPSPAPSSL